MSSPGYIRQRNKGVWEVTVTSGKDPISGKAIRVSRTVRGTKAQANTKLGELLGEVGAGRHGGTSTTVGELLDRWLPELTRMGRSPHTIAGYSADVTQYLRPALADIPLRRLEATTLNDLYTAMARRGLEARTIVGCHATISSALSEAVRWGWVTRNVARDARRPAIPESEIVVPTPQEVRSILTTARASKNPDMHSFLHVSAVTGARLGELGALRWSRVDHDRLQITRSLVDISGKYAYRGEKATKNNRNRRVTIDADTVQVLADHRSAMEKRAAAAGTTLEPDGYVWSLSCDGTEPYRLGSVSQYFSRLTTRLGHPMHIHCLRHFAVTQALGAGVPVHIVAQRTGHDPSVMMRVYAHWLPESDRAAADHLGGLLRHLDEPDKVAKKDVAAQLRDLLRNLEAED